MFKLLKAERMKLKRSPMWLVFFIMPILPALLGTLNYQNNKEILTSAWYSLWTQHTLFTCYFFLPIMIGIYCAHLMRLEHNNHNWNKVLTMPYGRASVFLAKLITVACMIFITEIWIGVLFLISGYMVGFTYPPYGSIAIWCLFGTLGGTVMAAIQLLLSMYIKSFALPVGIAFAGGLSGLVFLAKGFGHLWPYSLMAYGMNSNSPQELIASGYAGFLAITILYIAVVAILGSILIKCEDV